MLVILEGRKNGWVSFDTFLEIGNRIMCICLNNCGGHSAGSRSRRYGHKSSGGKVRSNSELVKHLHSNGCPVVPNGVTLLVPVQVVCLEDVDQGSVPKWD